MFFLNPVSLVFQYLLKSILLIICLLQFMIFLLLSPCIICFFQNAPTVPQHLLSLTPRSLPFEHWICHGHCLNIRDNYRVSLNVAGSACPLCLGRGGTVTAEWEPISPCIHRQLENRSHMRQFFLTLKLFPDCRRSQGQKSPLFLKFLFYIGV